MLRCRVGCVAMEICISSWKRSRTWNLWIGRVCAWPRHDNCLRLWTCWLENIETLDYIITTSHTTETYQQTKSQNNGRKIQSLWKKYETTLKLNKTIPVGFAGGWSTFDKSWFCCWKTSTSLHNYIHTTNHFKTQAMHKLTQKTLTNALESVDNIKSFS